MEFYNVKKREKVKIPDAKCTRVIYSRKTSAGIQQRYAVRAQDNDGTNLTKFLSKADFDKLTCPITKK